MTITRAPVYGRPTLLGFADVSTTDDTPTACLTIDASQIPDNPHHLASDGGGWLEIRVTGLVAGSPPRTNTFARLAGFAYDASAGTAHVETVRTLGTDTAPSSLTGPTIAASGGNVVVSVTGAAATNVTWRVCAEWATHAL